MKKLLVVLAFVLGFSATAVAEQKPVVVKVFHLPTCQPCQKVMINVIPPLKAKYGDRIQWVSYDTSLEQNYMLLLDLEQKAGRGLGTPTILIGNKVLSGLSDIADNLDKTLAEAILTSVTTMNLQGSGIDLLERFKAFGPWAVIVAGLIDGFNPCAFAVIVFFLSFLTIMGYRRREMAAIGAFYILAVYLTYLGMGLGLFKALYKINGFFRVSQAIYVVIGALSLYLGILALRDYVVYKKTGKTDDMALQLSGPIKNRIHKIVGDYYRRDKKGKSATLLGLCASAFVVGFLISLLEAVCTGQMYLPTIVFVLKEASLRSRAIFYLLIYNLMFVLPLVVILIFGLYGVTSQQFEALARKNMGAIKLAMAAVFVALGLALMVGIF